eukprot:TRINITY_DN1492_c0_g1_i18.p1 TRINITY_DN1492_c0_g1~~TRINITY_DN1492_c0_g1_i18.p1  ORF type:complete len:116 (+),score=12.42 TRINITY_DN1492_c0_g1_i18:586-933(+)
MTPATCTPRFDERKDSGDLLYVLNDKVPAFKRDYAPAGDVRINLLAANTRPASRYMHVTPQRVAESLQDRQTTLTQALALSLSDCLCRSGPFQLASSPTMHMFIATRHGSCNNSK